MKATKPNCQYYYIELSEDLSPNEWSRVADGFIKHMWKHGYEAFEFTLDDSEVDPGVLGLDHYGDLEGQFYYDGKLKWHDWQRFATDYLVSQGVKIKQISSS